MSFAKEEMRKNIGPCRQFNITLASCTSEMTSPGFYQNTVENFSATVSDVGSISSVSVWQDSSDDWYLGDVALQQCDNGGGSCAVTCFPFWQWFGQWENVNKEGIPYNTDGVTCG